LGYVRNAQGVSEDWLHAGQYELVVAQTRVKAQLSLQPLYDPENTRIRA
jgi:sarcosine dehydrogenase